MTLPLLVSPLQYPLLATAAFAVALAAWVFSLGPGRPVNRALAVFLTFRGFTFATVAFATDPRWGPLLYGRLSPYVSVALPVATVYFGLTYRQLHTGRRAAHVGWPLLALGALLWLALALDHELFWRVTFDDGTGVVTHRGPLLQLTAVQLAFEAAIGAVLLRDATRTGPGPRSTSLLLVALALVALPLYLAVLRAGGTLLLGVPRAPDSWANILLTFPVALVAAATLVRARARAEGAARRLYGRTLAGLGIAAGLGALVVVYGLMATGLGGEGTATGLVPYFVGGTLSFGALLLVAYAILRHQLFGLDVKVKWTLKQSTVAGIFVTVFFVVSETAQRMFEGSVGPVLGIAAAGALVFAIHPLQHLAQALADKAMPGVRAVGEMTATERTRAYLEAARQAWSDGSMSKDERAMLDRMREALAIPDDEAMRIEREAARGAA